MALRTRGDHYKIGTHIDSTKIFPASRMVSNLTGLIVQRNKAIVGENAFAHESGIHQDGILKYRETYEIMDPATVASQRGHSCSASTAAAMPSANGSRNWAIRSTKSSSRPPSRIQKRWPTKKKEVFDEDLEALVDEQLEMSRGVWELVGFQVTSGTNTIATAAVKLRDSNGVVTQDASVGDGPVDAIYSAIQRLTGVQCSLLDYRIRAVSRGKEAQGEVQIELEHNGRKVRGRGLSTDILEASALGLSRGDQSIAEHQLSRASRDAARGCVNSTLRREKNLSTNRTNFHE